MRSDRRVRIQHDNLRRRFGWNSLFVIAQSGWGEEDDKQGIKQAAFERHLVRPLEPEELSELLEQGRPHRSCGSARARGSVARL
jgi:hypothetical protein